MFDEKFEPQTIDFLREMLFWTPVSVQTQNHNPLLMNVMVILLRFCSLYSEMPFFIIPFIFFYFE